MRGAIAGVLFGASALAGVLILLDGVYKVDEGNVGVVTRWGQAIEQEQPAGLRVKFPIMTQIKEFDVRERRMGADMAAATANQLPITATVSMNWRMDSSRVLEVYKEYGTPEMFAANILTPKLSQASKAGLSQYQASQLVRDRTAVAATIYQLMVEAVEQYPVSVSSLQIENFSLPERYMESVMAKEQAREDAAREEYNLQRQKLEAQREVQTAEAERDALRARADGEAYATTTRAEAEASARLALAEAEAKGLQAINKALANSSLLIDYEKAKRWNGQMPTTILGSDNDLLYSMR